MASKFKIFCDSPAGLGGEQAADEKAGQMAAGGKREPLGLRQASTVLLRQQMALQQQQQQQQPLSSATNTDNLNATTSSSSTGTSSVNDEDQENDISMASLGSDFVPSILHDAEFDDDEEGDETEGQSFYVEEECQESLSEANRTRQYTDDTFLSEDLQIDDAGLSDGQLDMELSQAFKQHDESQLFKSAVYVDDINAYLHQLERMPDMRPLPNYMDFQAEIDSSKRAILINWLVEVSDEHNIQTETLFICINIIDRFLSKMSTPTCNFQLLGVAAMFIASKYEEIYPPYLYQFVEVTDDTYSGKQILQMEQEILKTLNFRISMPTISFFLRQIFTFNKFTKKVFHLAEYLCYLSLLDDQPFLEYYPSDIAVAAVILAAHQLDAAANISPELQAAYDNSNSDQLQRRTTSKGAKSRDFDRRVHIANKDLPFCIESLRALQERAYQTSARRSTDSAVYVRYSLNEHSCVAFLRPPKAEDLRNY